MEQVPSCEVICPQQRTNEGKITKLVVISSVIASLGGILMGYDMGIVSGALLQLRHKFSLTCLERELVVSGVLLGAFIGSLVAGSFVDRFGRRRSILGTSLLFIGGSIFLALSQNLYMVLVGRLVVGFGIALSTAAECTYISEIAPKRWRGMLVSLNELGITVGFLFSYLVGYFFIHNEEGWRYMFGIAAAPGFIQLVGVSCLPPSPHYLILRGNPIKAEEILKKIHPDCDSQQAVEEITAAVLDAKCSSTLQLISKKDNMRGRMFIGIMLSLLQQMTGNTNVLYYAPIIFQQFGYCSASSSTLASVCLGAIKVVTAVVALSLVDRVGRRALLSAGAFFMGLSVAVLGIITVTMVVPPVDECSSHYVHSNYTGTNTTAPGYYPTTQIHDASADAITSPLSPSGSPGYLVPVTPPMQIYGDSRVPGGSPAASGPGNSTESTSHDMCTGTSGPMWIRVISVVSLMCYISAYQFSFGIGTWLVLSEIFPTKVRGRCIGISTSAFWLANVVLAATFLESIDGMGIGYTFIMYACICFFSFFFIFFYVPETKQKTLEQISADLNQGIRCQVGCTSNSGAVVYHSNGLRPRLDGNGLGSHSGENGMRPRRGSTDQSFVENVARSSSGRQSSSRPAAVTNGVYKSLGLE